MDKCSTQIHCFWKTIVILYYDHFPSNGYSFPADFHFIFLCSGIPVYWVVVSRQFTSFIPVLGCNCYLKNKTNKAYGIILCVFITLYWLSSPNQMKCTASQTLLPLVYFVFKKSKSDTFSTIFKYDIILFLKLYGLFGKTYDLSIPNTIAVPFLTQRNPKTAQSNIGFRKCFRSGK